MTIVKQV